MPKTKTVRLIPCPRCHKPNVWDTKNPARPFCSKRCQLIDLDLWLTDQKKIPGEAGLDEKPIDPDQI